MEEFDGLMLSGVEVDSIYSILKWFGNFSLLTKERTEVKKV